MAKRPTRLRFTEDDLADSHVKKAADRADKAVDRAEKAADKLASKKAKPKLKLETDAAGSRKAKLRFEKAEFTEIERPSVAKHMASRGAAVTLTSKAHRAVSEYEDDNIGVQAVQETTKAVESTVYTVDHAVYSHKLKAYDKAEKLVEKSDKANVNALYEKFKKDNPDAGSNPFSRWQQKRAIKKEYAAAKAGKNTASTTASASKGAGKATGKAAQGAKNITERVTEFCTTHSKTILFVLIAGLLFMILSGMFSSCSAMFQGGTQIILVDLTAKLFGIGLREAAVKLAEDFGLNYDSRQKPSVRPRIREPTPEQKYQKEENHCYKVLTDYFHLLREWEKKYAPKQPDEEWNPLFAEALYKKNYIEYLLDILLYGSLEERKALVAEQRKEVLKLEQRIAELSADRTMHSRRNPKQLRAERER